MVGLLARTGSGYVKVSENRPVKAPIEHAEPPEKPGRRKT
jgi:hypothetical protein